MRRRDKLVLAITLVLAGSATAALAQSIPPDDEGQAPPVPDTSLGNPPAAPGDGESVITPGFDWTVGLGAGHTDNLTRVDTGAVSQNILQPTFDFTYNQQGSTLQAQVLGHLQYVDYLGGYYGNEFRGQLAGRVNWVIAPQRLNFELQDYSSVEPVSTRFGNSPANLQQVNVFVAGPTLSFLLGPNPTWHGQADLRYINTTASKTKDFQSQRGFLAARVIHDLNPTDNVSFNLEGTHVNFDHADPVVNANRYNEYNAYVRYESHLARVDLDLALGGSRVTFSQNWPSDSEPLVRASAIWHLNARNSLQLSGYSQLADATADLTQAPELASAQLTTPTVLVGRTVISPSVFRDRTVRLEYGYQGERLSVSLSPYYARLRQLNGDDLSRDGHGVVLGAAYRLTELTSLGATVGRQTTRYLSDQSRDRDYTLAVDLSQQLTPHWSWSVAFRHEQRNSNRPGFDYTENELFAFLYYRR